MLNDFPEERVPESLLKLRIDVRAIRQDLVLIPAHDCVLEKQGLSSVGQEPLGMVQMEHRVHLIAAHLSKTRVHSDLHEVIRLVLRLIDETLRVVPIILAHV